MKPESENQTPMTDPLPAAFADILRRLSPGEVAFLDRCYDNVNRSTERLDGNRSQSPDTLPEDTYLGGLSNLFVLATGEHAQFGTGTDTFELADGMINHAIDLGLIEGSFPRPDKPAPGQDEFHMTRLGSEFVRACRLAGKMSTATKSPEGAVPHLERRVVDGDITAMAQVIGDLRARLDSFGSDMRSDIAKLEAILVSMRQAR